MGRVGSAAATTKHRHGLCCPPTGSPSIRSHCQCHTAHNTMLSPKSQHKSGHCSTWLRSCFSIPAASWWPCSSRASLLLLGPTKQAGLVRSSQLTMFSCISSWDHREGVGPWHLQDHTAGQAAGDIKDEAPAWSCAWYTAVSWSVRMRIQILKDIETLKSQWYLSGCGFWDFLLPFVLLKNLHPKFRVINTVFSLGLHRTYIWGCAPGPWVAD